MKRKIKTAALLCGCVVFSTIFAGCSDGETKPTEPESTQLQTTSAAVVESASAPSANVDKDKTYEYEVREIWLDNNGQKIYGEAYVPVTEGKSPLVITSHGLGANHNSGASYGEKYARRGIAVYTFDFRGGSNKNNENKSDGSSTDMSVMTEVSDVETVLKAAREDWDFVDTDRIYLQGGSQGGLVSAIAGIENYDKIAGLLLFYSAFGIYDYIHAYFDIDNAPEEFDVGSMIVGKKYGQDLWDYDVRNYLPDFDKPVLILQGSEDNIVLPETAEYASKLFPDCEYHVIEGAGHGFSGEYHDKATEYALEFLFRHF